MAEIASLSLEVKSDSLKQAIVSLREMGPAASAAERSAQKWGASASAAGRSTEEFAKRVQRTINSLEFERQQMTRTTEQRMRYAALQRAGVSAHSAEGQAISASVAALQAQMLATKGVAASATAATGAFGGLIRHLGPLAAGLSAAGAAMSVWRAGMVAANLGEQSEQVGLTTEQLQAYRLAAAQAGIESEQLDAAMMRLTRAMGAANDGNSEMIARFEKLGVKLLDFNGELRKPADVLPELSRGLLQVSSNTERNSIMMELMGRSGSKLVTMLSTWAKGNDALINSAKEMGAVLDQDVISAWDRLDDQLKVTNAQWETFAATVAAPLAIGGLYVLENVLKSITEAAKNAGLLIRALGADIPQAGRDAEIALKQKQVSDIDKLLNHPARAGADQSRLLARRAAAQAELDALKSVPRNDSSMLPGIAPTQGETGGFPEIVRSGGARQPVSDASKKAGESAGKAYQKIIADTQQYIALKKVETDAIGMTAEAAARLKHEQELLGKAANDNTKLGPEQVAQLKAQAAAMAEVDAAFKSATFMNDNKTRAEEFVASQEMEQQALFMSQQAADALRFSTEALTRARQAGIELTPAQIESINQSAQAMAAAKSKTAEFAQVINLGRDVFKGFFSDMREGLMNGQTIWESFGNAAVNALNRIAEKLIEMAATQLFEAAFGGSGGGGGGGFLGSILGGIFGGGGGTSAAAGAGINPFSGFMMVAKGAAFNRGNVVPFAGGGVVNSATMFPMAGGRSGVMGEAGPEGILPLRRGRGGRLGVEASGGNVAPVIKIEISSDSGYIRAVARDESGKVVAQSAPKIVDTAVKESGKRVVPIMEQNHLQAGGDYR